MNTDTQQNGQPDIVFQEYSKDVLAFINGYGTIFHTVKASCNNPTIDTIEHRFGQDEGVNTFTNQVSLKHASQNLLTNSPKPSDQDYDFGVFGTEPAGYISYEELPTFEPEKRFRINWGKAFGSVLKNATYVWTWAKKSMFSITDKQTQHSSLLKVVYPTKKLTFRLIMNYLYPIKGNPYICVLDANGEESLLMQVPPVELKNEKLSFNYQSVQPSKCFRIEITNPLLGYTYEMRWISDKRVWTKAIN